MHNDLPDDASVVPSERGWILGLPIAPCGVLLQGIVQGSVLGDPLSRQGAGSATQTHLYLSARSRRDSLALPSRAWVRGVSADKAEVSRVESRAYAGGFFDLGSLEGGARR